MYQALMVVLREGVEAFLIVAIIFAYLRKTGQSPLLRAVNWGIVSSLLVSALLGYFLWVTQGVNLPLWEGILATITVILVGTLVIHMWRLGPHLKKEMESQLTKATAQPTLQASFLGVFVFTLINVSREGMEMALLLFQIRDPQLLAGIFLGLLGAVGIAYLWQQFGYLINLKHFFQITSTFLLLFTFQIAVQAFHEFTEAGIFPQSEALHAASEPYSLEGVWGQWFSFLTFAGCGLWLVGSLISERLFGKRAATPEKISV